MFINFFARLAFQKTKLMKTSDTPCTGLNLCCPLFKRQCREIISRHLSKKSGQINLSLTNLGRWAMLFSKERQSYKDCFLQCITCSREKAAGGTAHLIQLGKKLINYSLYLLSAMCSFLTLCCYYY